MGGGGQGNQGTYPFPNTNAGNQPTTPQPAQQTGGLQNWQARHDAMDQQRQQYQHNLHSWFDSRPRFGQNQAPTVASPTMPITPATPVAPTPTSPSTSPDMQAQLDDIRRQLSTFQPQPIPTGISSIPTTPVAPTPVAPTAPIPVAVAAPTPIVPPALAPTAPPPGSFQAMRAGGLATLRRR